MKNPITRTLAIVSNVALIVAATQIANVYAQAPARFFDPPPKVEFKAVAEGTLLVTEGGAPMTQERLEALAKALSMETAHFKAVSETMKRIDKKK